MAGFLADILAFDFDAFLDLAMNLVSEVFDVCQGLSMEFSRINPLDVPLFSELASLFRHSGEVRPCKQGAGHTTTTWV